MSATPSMHFQADSLRQRYVQNVDDAFRKNIISVQECQWLKQLSDPDAADDTAANRPRVDYLLLDDDSPVGAEMANALLISGEAGDGGTMYLDTLLYGLLRFDNRILLLDTLQRLFSVQATANETFEYQVIEGDPFEQRMLRMIDQQVEHMRKLGEELAQVPGLRAALRQVLAGQLRTALPGVAIDLQAPVVQLVPAAGQPDDSVSLMSRIEVQTLEDALVFRFTGQLLKPGEQWLVLDETGRALDEDSAQFYEQALGTTCQVFKSAYEDLTSDFWNRMDGQGHTRRQRLTRAFAESFRQELLRRSEDGTLGAQEFRHLGTLLQPVAARLGHEYVTRVSRLTLTFAEQEPLKLVGLLVISSDSWPGLLLYSPVRGLRRFTALADITAHYANTTGRDEVLDYLSANDQLVVNDRDTVLLRMELVDKEPFLDRVDSIIGLQQRSLRFALNQPALDFSAHAAMIDDALDIRHLIDSRLLRVDQQGRWLDQPQAFSDRWSAPFTPPVLPPAEAMGGLFGKLDPVVSAWIDQASALEASSEQWLRSCPDLERHAADAFNEYLAVMGAAVPDAQQIVVQWLTNAEQAPGSPPAMMSMGLVSLLLERISGLRDAGIPEGCQILRQGRDELVAQPEPRLTPALIAQLMDRIAERFVADYLQRMRQLFTRPMRFSERQLEAENLMAQTRRHLLALEASVLKRNVISAPSTVEAMRQALTRPVASLRRVFGDDQVEVCFVAMVLDDGQAIPMTNAFVLRQPLRPGRDWLFWSVIDGIHCVNSGQALDEALHDHLTRSERQEDYLTLFSEPDRQLLVEHLRKPGQPRLRTRLARFDGDFIHELQRREQERRVTSAEQALQRARASHLPAELFSRFVDLAQGDDKLSFAFDLLAFEIQNVIAIGQFPDWLKKAKGADLRRYAQMLDRYYLNNNPKEDFLSGITPLKDFAFQALDRQLKLDFPFYQLNPETITVKLTRYIPQPVAAGDTPSSLAAVTQVYRESLVSFALNHFSELHNAVLSLEFAPNIFAPEGLTSSYVDTLVRTLDLGAAYQSLLLEKLDESNLDYPLRRQRFIAQMPSRLLLVALEMQLQGRLSEAAYAYIENVIEMPDGVARQPVLGQDVILRPLQLRPRADMEPDAVAGFYLIGPKDLAAGPLILYGLFNKDFSFREYRDQQHLLTELRTSESLQIIILGRLDPLVVTRYSHGGFSEAHIPWSSESFMDGPTATPDWVTLAGAPIDGNVLHYLFAENLSRLKVISSKQVVTTAQADWASFVYLMSLGAEQILTFVPGRLGMLIAAWQSQNLFKASFHAAYDEQWGKALSEFATALGALVSSRNKEEGGGPVIEEAVVPEAPTFSWQNSQLTPELKARLRVFEVHDVALSTLTRDVLLHTYWDPGTRHHYAAVAGQVYQVQMQPQTQRWSIIGETGKGPRIRFNDRQQWELDIEWGLLGGGGIQTRMLTSQRSQTLLDQIFITEAQGMRTIRSMARHKARMITEAHQLAVDYLENSLFNLNADNTLDVQVSQVLTDFFGVAVVDDALLGAVRDNVISLFKGISDADFSPRYSTRYVIGRNRPGPNEQAIAFVIRSDPRRRIYFDQAFFAIPPYGLNWQLVRDQGFNTATHFRATTLLHELAHLLNDAHDIAYVNAAAPYPDLLTDSDPVRYDVRRDLERIRDEAFSHRTPVGELFTTFAGGQWRDFVDDDGAALDVILTDTGAATLESARTVFLTDAVKRRQLMLKNADSVALLVTLLGRRRYIT